MSKPSARKAAHQKKKQRQKAQRQKYQKAAPGTATSEHIAPTFNAEQLHAPTSLFGWLGQRVASRLRLRK